MKPRFHALDGLRGAGALLVMLYHGFGQLVPGQVFAHGYLSVDLFFVLSGFVLAAAYEQRLKGGLAVSQFAAARIRRLAPVYVLGAGLGLAVLLGSVQGWQLLPLTLAGLLLVPLVTSSTEAFPLNPPSWTLFIELVVNLGYAALARFLSTRGLFAIMLLCWAGLWLSAAADPDGLNYGWRGTQIVPGLYRGAGDFAAGLLIWRAHTRGLLQRLPSISPLLAILLWVAVTMVPAHQPTPGFDAAVIALVVPALVMALAGTRAAMPAWFTPLGALSYPLYACHFAFVRLALLAGAGTGLHTRMLVMGLAMAAAVLFAHAVALWLEPRPATAPLQTSGLKRPMLTP